MFPKPPQLFRGKGVTDDPASETYWKAANGIRLSGMPSFKTKLSDTQLWQVMTSSVVSLCRSITNISESRFHDPETFVPDPGSAVFAIDLFRDVPRVTTRILLPGGAPIEVKCLIDSGAGSLILAPSFVRANRVVESVGKTMTLSDLHFGANRKKWLHASAGCSSDLMCSASRSPSCREMQEAFLPVPALMP